MTCSKCGQEERAKGSSWGKKCLSDATRMRRRATRDATDATPDVLTVDPKRPTLSVHAGCAAEIAALTAEVARLKKEKGELAMRLEGIVPPRTAREVESVGISRANGHAKFCACIGCRMGA